MTKESKPRKKYPPQEGWPAYNQKLVRRGEVYFDLEFLKDIQKELKKQNKGKRGRPFDYPDSLIQFCRIIYHVFHLPYRQLEGFMKKLSLLVPGLYAPNYCTPCRRFRLMDVVLPACDPHKHLVVAVDSTGVKVTNRGEWMRKTHKGECRGWIKVHVAVDVESKQLVSLEVSDEKTGDNEMFKPLLEPVRKLKDVLADGAYDTRDCFEYLMTDRGLDPPGIKVRENASHKGLSDRAFAVRERRDLGYEGWKEKHGYGHRWSPEGYFSGVKRMFGETVRATSLEGMFREVKTKFLIYNMLLSM